MNFKVGQKVRYEFSGGEENHGDSNKNGLEGMIEWVDTSSKPDLWKNVKIKITKVQESLKHSYTKGGTAIIQDRNLIPINISLTFKQALEILENQP